MKMGNFESGGEESEIIGAPKPSRRENQKERELPILEYKEKIKEIIAGNKSSIIVGETGSGKTTQIPLIMREVLWPEDKVVITQPRRMAARSVAKYVAGNVGCRVGEEVGYRVRFEDRTTEGTRTNFMTDGILLRKLQEDPLLKDCSVAMVDEAHERSLNIDFLLGLLKEAQKKREEAGMESLKIIATSATLEKEKFAKYFGDAPMVEVPGRLFPVDKHYLNEKDYNPYKFDYTQAAADCVAGIVGQKKDGDILVFMPGEDEIKQTIKKIEKSVVVLMENEKIQILPLYGNMPPEDQDKIFETSDQRKVIVATNIAETSVTVPGVRHVIDSGLIKQKEFDPSTGINALVIKNHSQSGCKQRAGRAGRVEAGEYYALYSQEDFGKRDEFTKPEILRTDLAQVVLTMKKMGIDDVKSFEFIDKPDNASFDNATNTLTTLGALDENGGITKIGEKMAGMPLEPKVARMVIEAERHQCTETVCTIAAFLGGRPVFNRPKGMEDKADAAHRKFKASGSDFMTLLNVWNEYDKVFQQSRDLKDYKIINDWTRDNFLNGKMLNEVREIRYQLFRALRKNGIRAQENQDSEAIGKSIVAGMIGNLMQYSGRHSYKRVADGEGGFYIHPSSVVMGGDPQLIVPAEILKTNKTYARMVQVIKPEWLREVAPQMLREEPKDLVYKSGDDRVVQNMSIYLKNDRYGDALMREERPAVGAEAAKAFAYAIVNGYVEAPFVRQNKETAQSINDLWKRSEGKLDIALGQPIDSDWLKKFYEARLDGISSKKEAETAIAEGRINLLLDINEYISADKMQEMLSQNPKSIAVGGKDFEVIYDYSDYRQNKFRASIKIDFADVIGMEKIPVLPSGRQIYLQVIENGYEQFSGQNLAELKQKSRDSLVDKLWDAWRYGGNMPKEQEIENFDPLGESPKLPEPISYGRDPLNGNDLLAYPAMAIGKYYGGGYKCTVRYFKSAESAAEQIKNSTAIIAEIKAEKQKREEKEILLAPARQLLKDLKEKMETVRQDYHNYGFDYGKNYQSQRILEQAERYLEQDTKEHYDNLKKLQGELEVAFSYKENKEKTSEMVRNAVAEHYGKCPLCGNDLIDDVCNNYEHNLNRIDFALNDDEEPIEPAILSQIIADNGKIIAQLKCNGGYSRRRGRSEIYLVYGRQLGDNGWNGEPINSVKFDDFGKIMTTEQVEAKERELARAREEKHAAEMKEIYEQEYKVAEENVENGNWRVGSFTKGVHPQTGEDQWEITIGGRKSQIKYVVDRYGNQPTDENLKYYYSIGRTLVDSANFKLVVVRLENPLPEYKPAGFTVTDSNQEEQSSNGKGGISDLLVGFNKQHGRR